MRFQDERRKTFDKFIEEKSKTSLRGLSFADRKAKWIISTHRLYGTITTKWLKSYISNHSIKTTTENININEELIGQYEIRKLTLRIGNDVISLTPIGTYVMNYNGRIDIHGKNGVTSIVLDSSWDWKILKKHYGVIIPQLPRLENLNQTSFRGIIQNLSE